MEVMDINLIYHQNVWMNKFVWIPQKVEYQRHNNRSTFCNAIWDVMKEFRDEGKRKANATNMPVSQFFKNIFNL